MPKNFPQLLIGMFALLGLLVLSGSPYVGLLVILVCIGIGVMVVRRLNQGLQNGQSPPLPRLATTQSATPVPSQPPLVQRLHTAFRRNQPAQLEQALAGLPAWPISQQVQVTAQSLLTLKQSIYRAQVEGVPAPLIQRYLNNTTQAAETLWQLASKVDALGKQQVGYALVAPRLQQEGLHVVQLQQTAQAAQEGIALLVVSGIQTDALRHADEDLSALTRAMKDLIRT